MGLIHIKHKNLPNGALLDEREFDPAVHVRFDAASESIAEAIAELLAQNASDIIEQVAKDESVEQLSAIGTAEAAGKNRKTVLEAIKVRIDALTPGDSQ